MDEVVEEDLVNVVKVDDKILETMPFIRSIKEKLCGFACSDHIVCDGFKRLLTLSVNTDLEV